MGCLCNGFAEMSRELGHMRAFRVMPFTVSLCFIEIRAHMVCFNDTGIDTRGWMWNGVQVMKGKNG